MDCHKTSPSGHASLEQQAAAYYAPELPYHNFNHALQAVANGRDIVAACEREGIPIDAEVVYLALLFHDAGFMEDPHEHGCDTREAYSAEIAAILLGEVGMPRETIEAVKAAILATTRDGEFASVEQKAVRAADLCGMAAEYQVFRRNTDQLRKEQELLTGMAISEDKWRNQVGEVIGFYQGQEIGLTEYFTPRDGQPSAFNQRVADNLQRYLDEDNEATGPV